MSEAVLKVYELNFLKIHFNLFFNIKNELNTYFYQQFVLKRCLELGVLL